VVGRQIAHYRIEAQLGEGGMGVVYRAVDLTLDRPVAVKMLTPELARNTSLKERFQAEAKAQANLNHTNIATLYSFVQDGDNSFIVMEYVDGETFEEMIRRGPIPPGQAIQLFQQALSGLGFAHRAGIVHRDIKPGNLMVNRHGIVKVLDFGLAKVLGSERRTRSGVRVGSVSYMSPEQIRNEPLDARSDVYSLGVTLYEMLSGQAPFAGDSDYQVMLDHVNQPPPPILPRHPIPAGVEAAVRKALEKDPGRRFQNVEEFRDALQPLGTTAARENSSAPARRTPLAKVLVLGAAGVAVLALGFWAWHSRPAEGTPASLPPAGAAAATSASPSPSVPDNPKEAPQATADKPAAAIRTAAPGIRRNAPEVPAEPSSVLARANGAAPNKPPAGIQTTPLAPSRKAPEPPPEDPHANDTRMAAPPPQQGAPDRHFDGTWSTVLSCEAAAGALGYTSTFPSEVKEGVLHGEKGAQGRAGWLQMDGKILSDGSAKLRVGGFVGSSDYAVGQRATGAPFGYDIVAHFAEASGTGKRVEGRACSVAFDKER